MTQIDHVLVSGARKCGGGVDPLLRLKSRCWLRLGPHPRRGPLPSSLVLDRIYPLLLLTWAALEPGGHSSCLMGGRTLHIRDVCQHLVVCHVTSPSFKGSSIRSGPQGVIF